MSGGFGVPARVHITAEPLVRDLVRYRNKWVAIRDGDVIVEASTHADLVRKVRARQLPPGTFVARFIDAPATSVVVGVG
jgi:hypothetical protein